MDTLNNAKSTPAIGNSISFFTDDELNTTSVRDLYVARCNEAKQTPSSHLLRQLPATTEDIDLIQSIDLSAVYLGRKGLDTVFPVIAACHRVVHLNMQNVGLDAGTVLPLIAILKQHPGIRELNLSKNRIGTETVLKLCSIAYSRGLLYKVELDDAWVVEPLRKRLQKILDNNSVAREKYPVPPRRFAQKPAFDLIKDAPTPPPEVEACDVPVVPQIARMCYQLRAAILRHSEKMRDLQAMFRSLVPGVCTAKNCFRVFKLLDVTAADTEFSVHELSDAFGATIIVEGERVVRFGKIVAALREHCLVRAEGQQQQSQQRQQDERNGDDAGETDRLFSPLVATVMRAPPTHELRDLLDEIFDSRAAILESCAMIDIDAAGVLGFDDFVVGMAAATQSSRAQAEQLLCFWLDALGCGVPSAEAVVASPARNSSNRSANATPRSLRVPYKAMLQSLELPSSSSSANHGGEPLPVDEAGWRLMTPRILSSL